MPRIFDDIVSDKPVNVYAGLPVQETKALNAEMSQQYQSSRGAKDALDVMANNLDVEDRNYEVKKRVIDETKAKFKDLVSRGDYQNAKYLVQGVEKNLMMDNELQGALQSRKKEGAHYQGLKEALDKGDINQDIYNWNVEKTKQANKGKIEYDPNTMTTKNMFSGQSYVKDLSKEIYNAMDARIKDWKEESITDINGQQYKKTMSSPTGYFNMTTGKQVRYDEISDALRTELENTGEYRDFLKQEKVIDYHKQFKNADGSYREITKEDVNNLGLSDDKIKTIISGISPESLGRLAKDKSAKGQELYEEQKALRDAVSTGNLSKENIDKLYNFGYTKLQTEKYISPASAKGSYQTWDDKYLQDVYGLENLQHRHKLAQDKAKAELTISAAPETPSQLQQYKLSDIKEQGRTLAEIGTEISQLQTQLSTATDATKKDIIQRLQVLANKSSIIRKNNTSFEDDMRKKGYNTDKNYASYLNVMPGQDDKAMEYKKQLINNILSLPANKISSSLSAALHMMNEQIKGRSVSVSMSMEEVIDEINKFPDAKKVYDNVKSSMLEDASKQAPLSTFEKMAYVGTSVSNLEGLKENVEDSKVKFLEKEKTKAISTNIIAIDEDNNNPKDPTSNNLNREVRDRVKSLVQDPNAEFTTESGLLLYDIASGQVDGYTLLNSKGEKVPADLGKSKVNITSQSINGKVPVAITLYSATGDALHFDDEQKGQASLLVYPKNDDVTIDGLKRIGQNYLQNGKTNNDKIKGIQYLANAEYKTQLDSQIAPDFWNEKPKGYTEDIVINSNGQAYQLRVIKENSGTGETEFSIAPMNGNALTFSNLNGKPIKTFKSLDEFSTVFYNNQHQSEIASYIK